MIKQIHWSTAIPNCETWYFPTLIFRHKYIPCYILKIDDYFYAKLYDSKKVRKIHYFYFLPSSFHEQLIKFGKSKTRKDSFLKNVYISKRRQFWLYEYFNIFILKAYISLFLFSGIRFQNTHLNKFPRFFLIKLINLQIRFLNFWNGLD